MSDCIRDLERHYEQDVFIGHYPRSIGLFPIPEYPELEAERGMWSAALDAILTTLRYLAPATLLTLFWGQQSFLFKLLKHIDSAFRAIVFSSEEQKQAVLRWLAEVGPCRVDSLDTVWRHGWIVCGVLDTALPGACAGHPPTRLSLKHAQAIADHYLGVEPVFSRQELDSNDALSRHQEWKLATYLDRIRLSLAKLTPPVSKPGSQRTSTETTQVTLDYVAKGSGLTAAQIHNKMHFKIYPTAQQSLDPGEITILIRGPKDTYGMTVLPPILGKAQLIRQKLLGLERKVNYTENILPITQGATYLRSYGKNDMNKTYYIPKTKYDIEIEADSRSDHTKISYVVNIEGRYEISITSRGQSIVGSPYSVMASNNILSLLERDSFCLEDGEEIDIVDIKTDRKVVLRIVDFVTEKMLLKENGSLERITEDEAKILMTTENTEDILNYCEETKISGTFVSNEMKKNKNEKLNKAAKKVIMINRVCKVFNDIAIDKKTAKKEEIKRIRSRSQQDIPDVVNSTLTESNVNPFVIADVRDKYIVPENISVSLKTEKSFDKEVVHDKVPEIITATSYRMEENRFPELGENIENNLVTFDDEQDDILMVITSSSPSNPFLVDTYEHSFVTEKDLGTFVTSEYETNNSQNEEIPEAPIKILVEENITPSPNHTNPFIDREIIELERPKTPVFKIITGDIKNRDDSVYIDPKTETLTEEMLGNEFINPFFVHQHLQTEHIEESLPTTDFIIGAPVSLPPVIRASTPEPTLTSLILTSDQEDTIENFSSKNKSDIIIIHEDPKSEFSTPLHTNLKGNKEENNSATSSTFHSLDSDNIEILHLNTSNNQLDPYQIGARSNQSRSPKKDIWDSAYVSIDENNSSPDSNNNDNAQLCETFNKQKFSPSDDTFGIKRAELTNMGPAERELWQTCNELNDNVCKLPEDSRHPKWETRRPMFTPIIEESDRSISAGMKDNISRVQTSQSKTSDADPVTVAFAELNDMYHDYFPNSETASTTTTNEESKLHSLEVDYTIETGVVDSASEYRTDVKRHAKELEGKISEVQANVTESVSVSQTLHDHEYKEKTHEEYIQSNDETQFGDNSHTNIVLEKKKYWDDRIRQIEAKSQEATCQQKKKRLSSKQLRHNDSLTKKRGKQMVKNFLNAGELDQTTPTPSPTNRYDDVTSPESPIETCRSLETRDEKSDVKLVDKWKKYWDDKLETEKTEVETACFRVKSPKNNMYASSEQCIKVDTVSEDKYTDGKVKSSTLPVKQELPEEVFKAFETSPKRFFGTSRKQILNKIDTFLGKPSTVDESTTCPDSANHDSGLVSSRISLFHSISKTEEVPWERRKCHSLHNIYQRKDSDKNAEPSALEMKLNEIVKNKIQSTMEIKPEKVDKDNHKSNKENADMLLKQKRARIGHNSFNKSFDESIHQKQLVEIPKETKYIQKPPKDLNKDTHIDKYKKTAELRRKSFSRSEMDIFNKATTQPEDDGLDKYKSCDELPKINVKNFISLFESVSKTSINSKSIGKINKINSDGQNQWHADSSHTGAVNKPDTSHQSQTPPNRVDESTVDSISLSSRKHWSNKSFESISSIETYPKSTTESIDIEIISNHDKETTHLSLSDIELEIVESSFDKSPESSPQLDEEIVENKQLDYKSRFKTAKQYFQSLEELREIKKPRKLNECEMMLRNKSTESTESLEGDRPSRRVKRNIKSHSMPSSEISKIWNQLQEKQEEASASKLVKISEKFNVEDLFNDVMEGRLSRQGSLRGIPHKKAVLETFRSMENIVDKKLSPYEIAVSHLNEFAKENQIKNAQTYLTEYPYLPTTDPSKYHSRLDTKASGLISFKELMDKKPRRNSVPDLRLNPTFTVDL